MESPVSEQIIPLDSYQDGAVTAIQEDPWEGMCSSNERQAVSNECVFTIVADE